MKRKLFCLLALFALVFLLFVIWIFRFPVQIKVAEFCIGSSSEVVSNFGMKIVPDGITTEGILNEVKLAFNQSESYQLSYRCLLYLDTYMRREEYRQWLLDVRKSSQLPDDKSQLIETSLSHLKARDVIEEELED